MELIAMAFPGNGKNTQGSLPLPYLADLRIALNVAAADRTPLVIVYAREKTKRQNMQKELAKLAWSQPFIGQAQYVEANQISPATLKNFNGKDAFIVVQPGTFGLSGSVIKSLDADATAEQLKQPLSMALAKHQPSKLTYEEHRREGMRTGAKWKSATPNTDSGARRGRQPRR